MCLPRRASFSFRGEFRGLISLLPPHPILSYPILFHTTTHCITLECLASIRLCLSHRRASNDIAFAQAWKSPPLLSTAPNLAASSASYPLLFRAVLAAAACLPCCPPLAACIIHIRQQHSKQPTTNARAIRDTAVPPAPIAHAPRAVLGLDIPLAISLASLPLLAHCIQSQQAAASLPPPPLALAFRHLIPTYFRLTGQGTRIGIPSTVLRLPWPVGGPDGFSPQIDAAHPLLPSRLKLLSIAAREFLDPSTPSSLEQGRIPPQLSLLFSPGLLFIFSAC